MFIFFFSFDKMENQPEPISRFNSSIPNYDAESVKNLYFKIADIDNDNIDGASSADDSSENLNNNLQSPRESEFKMPNYYNEQLLEIEKVISKDDKKIVEAFIHNEDTGESRWIKKNDDENNLTNSVKDNSDVKDIQLENSNNNDSVNKNQSDKNNSENLNKEYIVSKFYDLNIYFQQIISNISTKNRERYNDILIKYRTTCIQNTLLSNLLFCTGSVILGVTMCKLDFKKNTYNPMISRTTATLLGTGTVAAVGSRYLLRRISH